MYAISRRRLRVGAALLVAAVAETACPVAHAGQDEASERIPSDAGGRYSPIEKTFKHLPPLPGGPRPECSIKRCRCPHPMTGAGLPRQNEFNFELEYQPSAGPLENFQFLLFYSGVRMPGARASDVDHPQWRSVITYLVPLL